MLLDHMTRKSMLELFKQLACLSYCNIAVQDHLEFSPRVDFFCQCDPDLTVHVRLAMRRSILLFTKRQQSNFCFVLV